jgi:hypothetical protein
MRLARRKRTWPAFSLPADRGSVTVLEVIAVPVGAQRDKMIHEWCVSVWAAFKCRHRTIRELLRE